MYEAYIGNQLDTINDTTVILNNPKKIGTKADDSEFNPQPGIVSGAVPTSLEEGCQYYIQVKSTSPEAYGNLYGPFCIRKCDITTNNNKDVAACITDSSGYEEELDLELNSWADSTNYLPGNEFMIQVLSKNNLMVANTGGFGTTTDTSTNSITLSVPPYQDLLALGISPDEYYLRVIATNSTAPHDTMGSLVDFTIGSIQDPPSVEIQDSVVCINSVIDFELTPYNIQSMYEWQLSDGRRFGPYNEPNFRILANANLDVSIRVREINFGCVGPWSDWEEVKVIGPPDAGISAFGPACVGVETAFIADYHENATYTWDVGAHGTITENNGDNIKVVFDTVGQYVIYVETTNMCGSDSAPQFVNVQETISISGEVVTQSFADLANSSVLVIDYIPQDSSLAIVDTFTTSASGEFFMNLQQPDMYVKAIPDPSNYPNQMPTYYNFALTWDEAQVVSNKDCGADTISFNTRYGTNPGGPGVVSGKVTDGSGKNANSGKPLPGMTLILQNGQGDPVTYAITGKDGWFEIEDVPLGEFTLIGDWPYLKNDQAPTLELTAGASNKDSLSVKVVNRTLEIGKLTGGVTLDTYPGKVEVYPQPADEALFINLGDRAPQDVRYHLIDMLGREVRSGSLQHAATTLDVAELNAGVYLLQLVQGEIITTRKIVIQ